MHTKYKTYQESQTISYSGKHDQFLSTLHLAVLGSQFLGSVFQSSSFSGPQYLSGFTALNGIPEQASGSHRYLGTCSSLCRMGITKEFPGKHSDGVKQGSLSLQRPLHCQQRYMPFVIEISLGLILWVLWQLNYEFMSHSRSLPQELFILT